MSRLTFPINDSCRAFQRRMGLILGLVLVAGVCFALFAGCESTTLTVGRLGDSGIGGCAATLLECGSDSDCCSSVCSSGVCVEGQVACTDVGAECTSFRDCCSGSCFANQCTASCTSDGGACELGQDCCSGLCDAGTCLPLGAQCLVAGNSCAASDECCSALCTDGRCDAQSSYCSQFQEKCSDSAECCSGSCVFVDGDVYGTCADAPSGPSNCGRGIAGSVCDGCNDCCSRVCVPYGASGLSVCQEAQGCRQTGELCANDVECCGGDADSGLPGAGNVTCVKDEDATFGICRNAMACSPQGNSCHFQNYVCGVSASSNKCCAADGGEGVCSLDSQGVPRCDGLSGACQAEGGACAFSEDCCTGACLPNASGNLVCQAAETCSARGLACTSSAECCPTLGCMRERDSSFGVCAPDGTLDCSLSGQLCGGEFPECCGDLPCVDGRCRGTGAP